MVPTRGLVAHDLQSAASSFFNLIGPLPAGVWLKRIYLEVSINAAGTIDWAASLGGSGEGSAEALDGGIPVVSSSIPLVSGTPAIRWNAPGAARFNLVVPVGVRIAEGSTWFVWGWDNLSGVNTSIHVGVELVELLELRNDK